MPLGQKSWLRLYCERIGAAAGGECPANPVGEAGDAAAKALLAEQLAGLGEAFGQVRVLTGVSVPLSRGIHPVLRHLAEMSPDSGGVVDAGGFDRAALDWGIGQLRHADDAQIRARLDGCRTSCSPRFAASLVTDMLLVRAVMGAVGTERMEVAEADINNVAGLLADPQAMAWSSRHSCYLSRLAAQGVEAFHTDPATCPATIGPNAAAAR